MKPKKAWAVFEGIIDMFHVDDYSFYTIFSSKEEAKRYNLLNGPQKIIPVEIREIKKKKK